MCRFQYTQMATPTNEAQHTVRLLTNDIIGVIQTEIARSAEGIYKSLSEKITNDVSNQVSNQIVMQLRGQTLFTEAPVHTSWVLPLVKDVDYYNDEYVIVEQSAYHYTNYGRILCTCGTTMQVRPPGIKLTKEVIDYVWESSRYKYVAACIIDVYNAKYAFAANEVHEQKIAVIRKEIEAEFEDRAKQLDERQVQLDIVAENNITQARLNEVQANFLEAERKEFQAKVSAEAARWKSTADFETAKKQIELIKQQLAHQAAQQQKREEELAGKSERLRKLETEISWRALLLNINLSDLPADTAGTESEQSD